MSRAVGTVGTTVHGWCRAATARYPMEPARYPVPIRCRSESSESSPAAVAQPGSRGFGTQAPRCREGTRLYPQVPASYPAPLSTRSRRGFARFAAVGTGAVVSNWALSTNARAPNPRSDASAGGFSRVSLYTRRSASRGADRLNSLIETPSNFRRRSDRAREGQPIPLQLGSGIPIETATHARRIPCGSLRRAHSLVLTPSSSCSRARAEGRSGSH